MNRRGTGTIFCLISALFFISKYFCTAIILSGFKIWDQEFFQEIISYVGFGLNICSVIALMVGIFYLVWADMKDKK